MRTSVPKSGLAELNSANFFLAELTPILAELSDGRIFKDRIVRTPYCIASAIQVEKTWRMLFCSGCGE